MPVLSAKAFFSQYEVQEHLDALKLTLKFTEAVNYRLTHEPQKRCYILSIPESGTSYIKGRQDLSHLLAISFHVQTVRNGLNIVLYPRGTTPVSASLSPDRRNIEVVFSTKYPRREDFDRDGKKIVVCIDPGHGFPDPGAQSAKSNESDVVLTMAKRLRQEIESRNGMAAFLTREGDYIIQLEDRPRISDRAGADVYISLHMNAFSAPTVHGFEIFYLSAEGGEQTINEKIKELEEAENSFPDNISGNQTGVPNGNGVLNRILFDLQRNATTNSSSLFAQALNAEMGKVGKLRNRGVQRAAFRVLKTVNTPSVLIEMGFITSPRDEDYYLSEDGRAEMSARIADGIERFLRENNVQPKSSQDILDDVARSYVYPKDADKIEVYVVQPGDTLGRIARRFNVSQKSIMTENPEISKPDLIVVGKALRIKIYSD